MKAGEWTLRSRRVVTPSGTRPADVVIRNETISDVLEYDGPEAEGVILDVGNLAVLPGLVALHREVPEFREGRWFDSATKDCCAGGVTTLIDLPPCVDREASDASAAFRRMAGAEGKIRVDCGLVVPLGRGQAERIEAWIEAGFLGVEAILDEVGREPSSLATESDLRTAMPILAGLGRPLLVDLGRIGRESGPRDEADRFHTSLPEREFAAIRLLIRLCRQTSCRVHLIHPSASEALPMIAEAHADGLPLTVETCPGHLGQGSGGANESLETLGVELGRRRLDARNRLWEGLQAGLVSAIGPDFPRSSPASTHREAVAVEVARLSNSPLRVALPAVWAEARRRGLTLDDLGRWLAGKTAAMLGLAGRKGTISAGLDADFVVFDPDVPSSPIDGNRSRFPEPAGPSATRPLWGQVEATILRGTMIYQSGQFFEHPRGSVVLRLEETQPIAGTDA